MKAEARCREVRLLVPAAICEQRRTAPESSRSCKWKSNQVTLHRLSIYTNVNCTALSNTAHQLSYIIPSALHVNVVGMEHTPVFVEVHHTTFPATRLQLFAKANQAHGPTAYRRWPVAYFQNPLHAKNHRRAVIKLRLNMFLGPDPKKGWTYQWSMAAGCWQTPGSASNKEWRELRPGLGPRADFHFEYFP